MEKTSKLKKLSDWIGGNSHLLIGLIWLALATHSWFDGMTIDFLVCTAISSVFACTSSIITEIKKGKK